MTNHISAGSTIPIRRPLFAATLLFALLVYLSVLLWPPEDPFSEKADGRIVTLTGTVDWKEFQRSTAVSAGWQSAEESSGTENLRLQISLQHVQIEAGIPDEIEYEIHHDDKVLCTLTEDLQGQDAVTSPGAAIRIRGKLRVYERPTNDGQFDSQLYYHHIKGYLFSLTDAQILAYSETNRPIKAKLYRIREQLADLIDVLFAGGRITDSEDASILKAMLLGETGLLGAETKEMYQMNGIIHIVCISGLHISLLGMGLFRLLRKCRVPLPISAGAAFSVIFLYSEMTGMHSSSFRAMIMFFLHLLAMLLGRTYDLLTALSLAAILLLLEQPMYICYSGFLYSFGAVIAIGALAPALPKWQKPLAVPLISLPIQLCNYYTFPLYSILLNLVVIPLMTVVMCSGLAAVGIGEISVLAGGTTLAGSAGLSDVLGKAAGTVSGDIEKFLFRLAVFTGKPVSLILRLYEFLCRFAQKLPGHTLVPGNPPAWEVVLYYGILVVVAALHDWKQDQAGRSVPRGTAVLNFWASERTQVLYIGEMWKMLCLRGIYRLRQHLTALAQTGAIAASVCLLLCIRPSAPLTFYMLDVGQGDGMFIQTTFNRGIHSKKINILVDGGSSSRTQIGKYVLKPFLQYHGVDSVDLAILTHDDGDHCSGLLELLEEAGEPDAISVRAIVLPDIAEESHGNNYERIESLAKENGIKLLYLCQGQDLEVSGEGILVSKDTGTEGEKAREGLLLLRCLHPAEGAAYEDANACSLTFLLQYRNFSGLLTGDLEKKGEEDFLSCLDSPETPENDWNGAEEKEETGAERTGKKEISEALRDLDFLKVAHHGSAYATTAAFLEKIQAKYALISCGKENRYGHPAEETVERLLENGMELLDTRETGQISIVTDGEKVRILVDQ